MKYTQKRQEHISMLNNLVSYRPLAVRGAVTDNSLTAILRAAMLTHPPLYYALLAFVPSEGWTEAGERRAKAQKS
ncbi:hypothetical protein E4U12_002151 [Claviceps purpurea]|nr:hypothetical protein E4U12_002151 [Claviceps purpurea]